MLESETFLHWLWYLIFFLLVDICNFILCWFLSHVCSAKEINKNCRKLITAHVEWCAQVTGIHDVPCIHSDLTEVMPANSFNKSASFRKKVRQIDKARLCKKQYCWSHHKKHRIFGHGARPVDLDVSGLPCPDFSRAGVQKRTSGPTISVHISHAKFHVSWQTPMLILENVRDWGLMKIQGLLSGAGGSKFQVFLQHIQLVAIGNPRLDVFRNEEIFLAVRK